MARCKQSAVTADEPTAEGYQNRALECLALADEVSDPHIAAAYMRLAERAGFTGEPFGTN